MEAEAKTPLVDLTPQAHAHIVKTMAGEGAEGRGLRIAVVTGGCSGHEYSLAFAEAPSEGDHVFEVDGLRVFVAAAGAEKLSGTVLDYVGGLYGGGLKFRNPQASRECGCGASFSTE